MNTLPLIKNDSLLADIPRAKEMTHADIGRIYDDHGNAVLTDILRACGMDIHFPQASEHYLWDTTGTCYIDLLGAFGALNCGHNHPRIRLRLINALEAPQLLQTRINPYQAELMALLDRITPPNLQRAYLGNSGAEATEAAIKTAVAATRKSRIAYTHNAFHGKTLGALAVTGSRKYQAPFKDLLAQHPSVPYNDPDALEALLAQRNDIAAFIVEPIQGEGGIRVPDSTYLQTVKRICAERDVLLILDEIQTGLGRTGAMFCGSNIEPDILLIGKSLGGGYVPISAMMTTDALWNAAYGTTETCLLHSSTFSGITTACAVASETIRVLIEEDLPCRARENGDYFLAGLHNLAARHELIREVRGRGLMIGIQLKKPFLGNVFTEQYLGQIVAARLFSDHNIITSFTLNRPDILRLEPPLTIAQSDIDRVLDAFDRLLTDLPKAEQHVAVMAARRADDVHVPVEMGAIVSGQIEALSGADASVVFSADEQRKDPTLLRLLTRSFGELSADQQALVTALYINADSALNQRAVQAARNAAPAFFKTPIQKRHHILRTWRKKIEDNVPELARLGTLEGFNYKSMLWQLDGILNYAHPDRLASFEQMLSPQKSAADETAVHTWNAHPGAVGIAPSQNGTIGLSAMGLIAAISAGRPFVLCAGYSATTYHLLQLMVESFVEEDVDPAPVNAIWSRSRRCIQEWSELVDQNGVISKVDQPAPNAKPAMDYFCYWGARNEQLIGRFAAAGIRGSYDLNGSDPVIVNGDADLEQAVEALMLRYEASGQFCISPKRAIVHSAVADEVMNRLNKRIGQLRAGELADPLSDLMPFMRPTDRSAYSAAMQEAYEHDATVYLYGKKIDSWNEAESLITLDACGRFAPKGSYLTPAIVRVPRGAELKVNREEMFSPLLSFEVFDTRQEAVSLANSSPYAIRASIWSNDAQFVANCTVELDTASVIINAPHLWSGIGATDLGGAKESGVNIGWGGAKFLVEELAGERKVLRFPDSTSADVFIDGYWRR